MSLINRKPLIIEKIKRFNKEHPEYTFGEMLHSIITNSPTKINLNSKGDLLKLTDDLVYSGLDTAINNEIEDLV